MYIPKTDRTPRAPVRIALTRHSASHYSATRGPHAFSFHRMTQGWAVSTRAGNVWSYSRPTLALALLTAFRAQGPWSWGYNPSARCFADATVMVVGHAFVAIDYGHGIMLCRKLEEPKTDAESTQLAQLRAIAQDAFDLRARQNV